MPINRQLLSRLEQRLIGTPGEATLHAILDDFGDESELDAQVKELERQAEAENKKLCLVIVHCAREQEAVEPALESQPEGKTPVANLQQSEPEPQRAAVSQAQPKRAKRKGKRKPKPEPESEPELQPEPLTAGQRRRRRRQEAFRRWRSGEDLY